MSIFIRDVGFPEAPVRLPDGDFLFVEMSPDRGWTIRVSADGSKRTVLAKTGRPNGLAMDRNGFVWVAETAKRACSGCRSMANSRSSRINARASRFCS